MSLEAQKAKQVIIDEIKEKLDGAQSAVVINYMGISVAQADAMRKKLREARLNKQYSQKALAEASNVSKVHYQRLETGKRNPSLSTAIRISDVLGEDVRDLFPDL